MHIDQKLPAFCDSMPEIRREIDRIDGALVALLAERASYVARAVEIKTASGLPALIPERVDEVIAHVRTQAEACGFPPDLAETLWRELVGWFVEWEERQLAEPR